MCDREFGVEKITSHSAAFNLNVKKHTDHSNCSFIEKADEELAENVK
jgi:hypothetical protein